MNGTEWESYESKANEQASNNKKSIKRIELHNLTMSYYLKLFDLILYSFPCQTTFSLLKLFSSAFFRQQLAKFSRWKRTLSTFYNFNLQSFWWQNCWIFFPPDFNLFSFLSFLSFLSFPFVLSFSFVHQTTMALIHRHSPASKYIKGMQHKKNLIRVDMLL